MIRSREPRICCSESKGYIIDAIGFKALKKTIALLLVIAVALAGCAGPPPASSTTSSSPSPPITTSGTTPPSQTPGITPTPSISDPLTLQVGGSGKYRSIQQAIDSAPSGATIQVAQGVYTDKINIAGAKDVSLQGGWSSDFSTRNKDASTTILDGAGVDRVINIIAKTDMSIGFALDGFTIKNGNAKFGAGIFAQTEGKQALINLKLVNNVFTANKATNWGAAMSIGTASADSKILLELTRNQIYSNESGNNAGGLTIKSFGGVLEATLDSNSILNNTANNFGGGISLMSDNSSMTVTLKNNSIRNNKVTLLNSGVSDGMDGGGIAINTAASADMKLFLMNNVISHNEAPYGGGIAAFATDSANLAVVMTNNILSRNVSDVSGGGIFCLTGSHSPQSKPGGSILWKLANNDIVYNASNRGVGGISSNTAGGGSTTIVSRNDIIWGNTDTTDSPVQVKLGSVGGTPSLVEFDGAYSLIPSFYSIQGALMKKEHIMDKDPLFADIEKEIYYLRDDSPCIDAGSPDSSFNDGQRPPAKGTERNDLGAYGGPYNFDWPVK